MLQGPNSDDVEFIVTLGTEYADPTAALGVKCVVLDRVIGSDDLVGPTPVGCAYPFSKETVPSISMGYGGLADDDSSERLTDVASKDWVDKAVTLE